MQRRGFLTGVGALAGAALAQEVPRRNLLLIVIDGRSAQLMERTENSLLKTPLHKIQRVTL